MSFEVLDVGDGACSVVECLQPSCSGITTIDCGTWRAPASRPAEVLVDALGPRLRTLERLVVTHFDSDHWQGLHHVARQWQASGPQFPDPVEVIYPRVFGAAARLPAGHLAFISTAQGSTGVRALDLLTSWREVAAVRARPLASGDWFEMGCDRWEVIWPPANLAPGLSNSVERALHDLDDLADRMQTAGADQLRCNLDEAYSNRLGLHPGGSEEEMAPLDHSDPDAKERPYGDEPTAPHSAEAHARFHGHDLDGEQLAVFRTGFGMR